MEVIYDNFVFSLQKYGGISTYWFELSTRLLNNTEVDLRFVEVAGAEENVLRKKLEIKASQIMRSKSSLLCERFKRVRIESESDTSIFHSSYYRVGKSQRGVANITTVHDFTHDFYYSGLRTRLHNFNKNRAIKESDLIITVSNNTRNDLLNFLPSIDSNRVVTIYNGVSEVFRKLERSNLRTDPPYFLYVGSREAYKNFPLAVDLTELFPSHHLYIVGAPLTKKELRETWKKLKGRVKVFTGITTEELNELYNGAFCLLYLSSYEGFGIPLLEAMRAECPFIAYNKSSIPEVAGRAGILIDDLKLEAVKDAAAKVESNRNTLIRRGVEQASKFSWDICFRDTFSLYKKINNR